jgi:hypothetical protein
VAMLERHRSSIYRTLVPILGEEETEAMLSQFPASEGAELVTKEHLRAELADLRTEMAELRTDLKTDMAELRTDLKTDMAELRTEMHSLANRTTVWLGTSILAAAGLVIAFG